MVTAVLGEVGVSGVEEGGGEEQLRGMLCRGGL